MFYDDNWMGTLNYTINNLTGLLPFTPQYEFKLSGSYTIPKVDIDVGGRFRTHSGRPFWQQESYPQLTQFGGPENGVVDPGGLPQIVAVDPKNPTNFPTLTLFDLHLEKRFKFGKEQSVRFIVDGFNIFNTSTPLDIDVQADYGRVNSIPQSRRFRFGLRYEF